MFRRNNATLWHAAGAFGRPGVVKYPDHRSWPLLTPQDPDQPRRDSAAAECLVSRPQRLVHLAAGLQSCFQLFSAVPPGCVVSSCRCEGIAKAGNPVMLERVPSLRSLRRSLKSSLSLRGCSCSCWYSYRAWKLGQETRLECRSRGVSGSRPEFAKGAWIRCSRSATGPCDLLAPATKIRLAGPSLYLSAINTKGLPGCNPSRLNVSQSARECVAVLAVPTSLFYQPSTRIVPSFGGNLLRSNGQSRLPNKPATLPSRKTHAYVRLDGVACGTTKRGQYRAHGPHWEPPGLLRPHLETHMLHMSRIGRKARSAWQRTFLRGCLQ